MHEQLMQSMKSIVVAYPYFQSLPKGIKRMLVTSEDLFFSDAKTAPMEQILSQPRVMPNLGFVPGRGRAEGGGTAELNSRW